MTLPPAMFRMPVLPMRTLLAWTVPPFSTLTVPAPPATPF